ncbi:MAG: carbohydrate-binding protein [Cyclobacteriaceae bacterium]
MKKEFSINFIALTALIILASCGRKEVDSSYTDSTYTQGIQTIPGKLQCEYYDFGGEGVSFHDMDTSNNGSGKLNKGSDYLSTFRKDEAVDISYTKFRNDIDNSIFNKVQPEKGQLYIGWTEPGEWTKYTLDVKKAGTYRVGIMYTSNQGGQISLMTDKGINSGTMDITSTYDAKDTIQWRQWHHWNLDENIGEIELAEGIQSISLHTVTNGQMNYDYLSFTYLD